MKKLMSAILIIGLMLGLLPMQAFALDSAWSLQQESTARKLGMEDIGPGGYKNMRTTQKMLDVLKVTEGYTQKAYSDNTQYSIGYGTKAKYPSEVLPNGPAGYAEAEARLLNEVRNFENMVNNYCRVTVRKQPTQNQFDALVCFTYNTGSGWFFGSRLAAWLGNPTTEIDFMNAFGQWCHVGTTPWYGLAQRRIREALIFLKNEYYLPGNPRPEHLIKAEEFKKDPVRYVRPNGSLPYYASIIMEFDSPTDSFSGDRIEYRQYGDVVGALRELESDHYTFNGWAIVAENNNSIRPKPVSSDTVVEKNLELAVQWGTGSGTDPDLKPEPPAPQPPMYEGLPFTDISKWSWYGDNVKYVYDNGYMAGTSDTTFSPDMTMTRAMLVQILYRVAGSPEVAEEDKEYFVDTKDAYFTDAVGWAKANGIVDGVGERRFEPGRKVIRQDAEVIFYKFCVEYLEVSSKKTSDLSKFEDLDELSDYADEAVQWAVAVEMMAGVSRDGKLYLNPRGDLTRAEGATLITRCVRDIIE